MMYDEYAEDSPLDEAESEIAYMQGTIENIDGLCKDLVNAEDPKDLLEGILEIIDICSEFV